MVIFHYPRKLSEEAAVASAVRPVRMFEAFESIGEEVIPVAGDGMARVRAAQELELRLASNSEASQAVLYSESVNIPPALTWLRRSPRRMSFDYKFLQRIHDRGIPTGLFYRDVHWVLGRSKAVGLSSYLRHRLTPYFAKDELRRYEQSLDILFLPHKDMQSYVPRSFPNAEVRSLPPGGEHRELDTNAPGRRAGEPLKLLYVGNIAPPIYDLRPYVDAVEAIDCATLKLVTRPRALSHFAELYDFEAKSSVTVTFASGEELVPLYQESDIAFAALGDEEYLAFAMPVKVFEAISFGVPLIVSSGLKVTAQMVEREKLGWVVENTAEFNQLLQRLVDDPAELEEKRHHVIAARERHSWEARAREVVEVLRAVRERTNQDGSPVL